MNPIITVVIPTCIAIIVVPLMLKKLLGAWFNELTRRKGIVDDEHFTVGFSHSIKSLFLVFTLFCGALFVFSFKNGIIEIWVHLFFGLMFILPLFLLYCVCAWRVTVHGEEIIIRRPFHFKKKYHLNELKGYTKCDDGGKIIKMNGKTACLELIFVTPPLLYNYFLKHEKILPSQKTQKR